MKKNSFLMLDGKVILWLNDRVCETSHDLLSSVQFKRLYTRCVNELIQKNSKYAGIFGKSDINEEDKKRLLKTLHFLTHLPAEHVIKVVEGSDVFFEDKNLLNGFVEYLYNYWRHFQRLIISKNEHDYEFDVRPNRTFNRTIEHLTALIRNTYRDIQENITGNYPRIYRQVSAGAEIATITGFHKIILPEEYEAKLHSVPVIEQALIYPPLIFKSTINTRTGMFERVNINPIHTFKTGKKWLCFPAKVGKLLILVYFTIELFELNFSMCNLFEMASIEDLKNQPDAIVIFGAAKNDLPNELRNKAVFYDDEKNDILVGMVPNQDQFGYFGYLKKLVLTLHNIKMMKIGRMPFHGALFQLKIKGVEPKNVLLIGDSGAGKSETLEAFRTIASKEIEDLVIVADDMGSLEINESGEIIGYGTETGAFVRLDDLQPGYAYGQMDRAVLMNPNQVNARVVIPVTSYDDVIKGNKVGFVLYANNYDPVVEKTDVIQLFKEPQEALGLFRRGRVMSKGTTTTTGVVETYFANIFGPPQYREMHERIVESYFTQFFKQGVFVGQILTQLGVSGKTSDGPKKAARELLELIKRE